MESSESAASGSDCIFCAIASKKRKAAVLLTTADYICLAPLTPEVPGHTLIVSKAHYADLREAPVVLGADFFMACQRLAAYFAQELGAEGFNLLMANGKAAQQSVPHFHVHFLPRRIGDGVEAWPRLGR